MTVYEVVVAAPLFGTLTYAQPVDSIDPLPLGLRVLVPLKNRLVTGYVLTSLASPPDVSYQIKPILERLDPAPLFPEQLIPFFRWVADYYHHPLGEVIQTALPSGIKASSGYEISLTESGNHHLPPEINALNKRTAWMDRLLTKKKLLPGTVRNIRSKPAMQTLVQTWQKKGWIEIKEVIVRPQTKEKNETVVRLNNVLEEKFQCLQENSKESLPTLGHAPFLEGLDGLEGLKKSEQKTLDLFFHHSNGRSVLPRVELTRQYPSAGKALHSLAEQGFITLEQQRVYRNPFGKLP
ncbi:MAG: hypothetical protein D3916_08715, partial [Candidatus Electrothrix sp. MAN1_4]|nr:hypothetical protein [Candidatus Electrothrix sp. MAN1_4]